MNLALQVCFEMMERAATMSTSIYSCLPSISKSTMIGWADFVSVRSI